MSASKPLLLRPEDEDIIVLRNEGVLPHKYTASQPRRTRLESSSPWKPQFFYT